MRSIDSVVPDRRTLPTMSISDSAATARESARVRSGQFGHQQHTESSISLQPGLIVPEWIPQPGESRRRLTDALGRRMASRAELKMLRRMVRDFQRDFELDRYEVPLEHESSWYGMLDARDDAIDEDRESLRQLNEQIICALATQDGVSEVSSMLRSGVLEAADVDLAEKDLPQITSAVVEQSQDLSRRGVGTGITHASKSALQRQCTAGTPMVRLDLSLDPSMVGYEKPGVIHSQSIKRQRFIASGTGSMSTLYWQDWEVRTDDAGSILLYRSPRDPRPAGAYLPIAAHTGA